MDTLASMVPNLIIEMCGYLAGALVLLTFYTKTMIQLRYIAICSNFAFIIYATLVQLNPILVLHALLLPLNLFRLWQLKKLIADVSEASEGDFSIDWLLPYMSRRHMRRGEYLFHEGDHANQMFYISRGTLYLPEVSVERGAGQMIGEIGLFSPHLKRISSAQCKTDCDLLSITDTKVLDLYYQNPKFGIYLIRLITGRLIQDVDRMKNQR
ncbi:MAG: cyclic nucleotide-binding domain-containing protein [Sedimenticolaceae bacterium]|jgi:hypothetical protein